MKIFSSGPYNFGGQWERKKDYYVVNYPSTFESDPPEGLLLLVSLIFFRLTAAGESYLVINNSDTHTQGYYLRKTIGFGRESIVFASVNDYNESVCIKIEPIGNDSQIMNEIAVLQILKGCQGVPAMLFTGTTTYLHKKWRAIVTDVVGDYSMADLRNKLSLSEVNYYANISINILQNIHKRGIIHNDIKPEHFVFCKNTMYLVDYGSAGSLHSKPQFTTLKYSSPDFYCGLTPNEKSDFESLWFTILSLQEQLPWDVKGLSDVDIFRLKMKMLPEEFKRRKKRKSITCEEEEENKGKKLKLDALQQLAKTFASFT